MKNLWYGVVLSFLFILGGCQTHLAQETKSSTAVSDVLSSTDSSKAKVSQDTKVLDTKAVAHVKDKGPVTEDTKITIKRRGTKKRPGTTIVIDKHRVEGEVKDTKSVNATTQSATTTTGKSDDQKNVNTAHNEKSDSDGKVVKDGKPSIPMSLSCLGAGLLPILIIVGAILLFPGLLPGLLTKLKDFVKGFWQKFKDE